MTNTIYLDMDGVVADFDSAAEEVLGIPQRPRPINGFYKLSELEWKSIKIKYPRFYRDLPKMEDADQLVDIGRRYRDQLGWNLLFLTAVPKEDDMHWAFWDKIHWVKERYPEIAVHFGPHSFDKWRHCRPGDILVDDRADNCQQWREAGGWALEVKNRSTKLVQRDLNRDLSERLSFKNLRDLNFAGQ